MILILMENQVKKLLNTILEKKEKNKQPIIKQKTNGRQK